MKINILGGGPAALYFAILMKKQNPAHAITILERDGPNDTFGWGIVFSDRTYAFLKESDPESYEAITRASQMWEEVVVIHKGETINIGGNGFSGIARLKFLNILQDRCRKLGVDLRFNTNLAEPADLEPWLDCDLFVGADGANSLVRRAYAEFFLPIIDTRQNRYIWLGTPQTFHGLTMIFRQTETGLFIAHAYQFSPTTSTFIVECPPETWLSAGLANKSEAETCAYLAEVFKAELSGQPLLANNFVRWLNFPLIKNKRWYHRHLVLLGDALHTAHFSIGSGTKLAVEDSMALAKCFAEKTSVPAALAEFQRVRKPVVDKFQDAALNSLVWLENVQDYLYLDPLPLAFRVVTRSKRVGLNRLKRQDPAFAEQYTAWRAAQPPTSGPIPAEYLDLFQKKSFGHLATLMADGTPHVTSVWVDYDGQYILLNSAKGRQKDISMEKRRQVALEIPDPDEPNRYILIRGEVVEITEAGADAHLDKLAQRYLGRDTYPPSMRFPGEVRRLYKVLPKKVTMWNPFG